MDTFQINFILHHHFNYLVKSQLIKIPRIRPFVFAVFDIVVMLGSTVLFCFLSLYIKHILGLSPTRLTNQTTLYYLLHDVYNGYQL